MDVSAAIHPLFNRIFSEDVSHGLGMKPV